MENIENLTQEIVDKLAELEEMINQLKSLSPVSHKSKAKIQFVSGVLGAIQENNENKRLNKLINEPLVNGKSFYQIALLYIPQTADYLVEKQLRIQQLVDKEDKRYYGFVVDIFNYIDKLTNAWYNYSPDMANEVLKIGDDEGALAPSVLNWTKESIKKLDLPQNVAEHYAEMEKGQPSPSGCMGSFLLIAVSIISILSGSLYGLYQLFI
jgi:hypothetical protein